MYLSAFLTLALAAGSVVALPAASSDFAKTKVFEKPATVPTRWAKLDNIVGGLDKGNTTLELRIQLTSQNTDKFHDLALNIATPGHELYGKHLSQAEIDQMIAPKDESKSLVLDWLSQSGLADKSSVSSRGNAVIVTASVSEIEQLLAAEYNAYTNSETGEQIVRTLEYSLPESLDGHVRMVQPTNFFGFRSFLSSDDEVEAAAAVAITPAELSTLYNFASSTDAQSNGRMGIAGFLEQWPSKSDLSTFMNRFAIFDNADETYTCALINGGTCPASPGSSVGVEANLDVQYARAITKDIPNVFYSTGGRPPLEGSGTNTNEPYLEFLEYLQGLDDDELPNTVSISYGDDESTVPLSYADTVCDLFSQIGARGVSITASSGDSSVGTTCKTAAGTVGFTTAFPAACPWITSVGGTSGVPEAAWTSGGAGLQRDLWPALYFNASGRAYPDVSAQATAVRIVVSGSTTSVSGTSCSSPIFASIIQLINSARLADGKAALGFLNPWLYSNASTGFNDIASGSTKGCRGVITGGAGFSAASGWDPATGLGTPNFAKLKAISDST
ncbi:hypothetical protein G7054_g6365 [Neopestalotiopsis clavispora]|nr:hypothetical protein G7054_g6365 [Neopestalotiopsis clavispora]